MNPGPEWEGEGARINFYKRLSKPRSGNFARTFPELYLFVSKAKKLLRIPTESVVPKPSSPPEKLAAIESSL